MPLRDSRNFLDFFILLPPDLKQWAAWGDTESRGIREAKGFWQQPKWFFGGAHKRWKSRKHNNQVHDGEGYGLQSCFLPTCAGIPLSKAKKDPAHSTQNRDGEIPGK